jgi:glutamine synthetase
MIATAAAARALARRSFAPSIFGARGFASLEAYEDFGKNVFTGKVAEEYLVKHGASPDLLKDPAWVKNDADVVANAVFDW